MNEQYTSQPSTRRPRSRTTSGPSSRAPAAASAPPPPSAAPAGGIIPDASGAALSDAASRNAGIVASSTNPNPVSGPTSANPYDTESHANTSTANHLHGLLDQGSPLMQWSKTQALQQQNERGLLNSSMAIGEANRAMVETMTPIAAQDAQHAQTLQQNTQRQGHDQRLEQQRFAQDTVLEGQRHEQRLGELDRDSLNRIGELGAQTQNRITELGVEHQNRLDQIAADNSPENARQLARQTSQIQSDTLRAIGDVMSNNDIAAGAKDRMIEDLLRIRDADIAYAESLYPTLPGWDPNSDFVPSPAPAPRPAAQSPDTPATPAPPPPLASPPGGEFGRPAPR